MKKLMFLALMGWSCLLLTAVSAQAQVSRNGGKGSTEVRQEQPQSDHSSTTVSRKKAPGKTTSTKMEAPHSQGKVDSRTSAKKGTTQQNGRYESSHRGNYPKAKGYKYKSKNSKAKCGVNGCEHPGKHTGLHQQQRNVRPIQSKKAKY